MLWRKGAIRWAYAQVTTGERDTSEVSESQIAHGEPLTLFKPLEEFKVTGFNTRLPVQSERAGCGADESCVGTFNLTEMTIGQFIQGDEKVVKEVNRSPLS